MEKLYVKMYTGWILDLIALVMAGCFNMKGIAIPIWAVSVYAVLICAGGFWLFSSYDAGKKEEEAFHEEIANTVINDPIEEIGKNVCYWARTIRGIDTVNFYSFYTQLIMFLSATLVGLYGILRYFASL